MKKFLSVLIPVILLSAMVGVYVVNHYCMVTGKLTEQKSCCSKCDDNCCKKNIKVFRFSFESDNLPLFEVLNAISSLLPRPNLNLTGLFLSDLVVNLLFEPSDPVPLEEQLSTIILRI
ncbi:MAG: hypothetical protein LC117_02580 [Bacteroidia bacterium]|nr:hypothetical protein [Bacteroidia bacterium]MCZ2276800.1 hypothetical protein [Bacteroidia bacterium]